MPIPIDTKLPLNINTKDGFYSSNTDIRDSVKQSLKMLFLTSKGERIRDIDFGIGVHKFLFEIEQILEFNDDLSSEIRRQISKYMPYIKIIDLSVKTQEEKFNIKLFYNISNMNISDSLTLEV